MLFRSYSNEYLSPPENYIFTSLASADKNVFSKTDLRIMEEIYDHYKRFNEFDLSDYSHKFVEWKRFEADIAAGVAKFFCIEEDDFFREENEDTLFAQNKELLKLSKEHYRETA